MAQQPNMIELYEAAAQGFRQTLSAVKPDQMGNTTPCSEWSVQNLINHNVKIVGFVNGILTGNITVNPMDVEGTISSDEIQEALDAGVARNVQILKQPGMIDSELNTPFGAMPTAHFMLNPIVDLLIHRWDLAKGTSQNASLDSGLVDVCYSMLSPNIGSMRGPDGSVSAAGVHVYGPPVSIPNDASTQNKLLGITGRNPNA